MKTKQPIFIGEAIGRAIGFGLLTIMIAIFLALESSLLFPG